jgi:hypothetical protein
MSIHPKSPERYPPAYQGLIDRDDIIGCQRRKIIENFPIKNMNSGKGPSALGGGPQRPDPPRLIHRDVIEKRVIVHHQRYRSLMFPVEFGGRGQIDIREDVAVHHQKGIGAPETFGILNPSPCSQEYRLSAEFQVFESTPMIGLAQKGFDLVGKMMGIQYQPLNRKMGQVFKNPGQQRTVEQREERLRLY